MTVERRWASSVGIVGLLLAMMLGGCSSHDGQVRVGDDGDGITTRTWVGQAVCAVCHSAISSAYSLTAHGASKWGGDFHNKPSPANNVITGYGGRCNPCHTVGYQEGGFVSDAQTPQLAGIGCEECHGPGSEHAAAPSEVNINHTPDAQTTCGDCHVPTYKLMRGAPVIRTAADLRGTAPGRVSPHNRQAPMLAGWLGFERPIEPSPHSVIENTCLTCHLNENQGSVQLRQETDPHHGAGALHPDLPACGPCHGTEQQVLALFEEHEEHIVADLIEIGGENPSEPGEPDESASGGLLGAYAAAHGIDLQSNNNPDDPAVQNYKAARYDYSYVLADGSFGAHNPPFAEGLLEDARRLLRD